MTRATRRMRLWRAPSLALMLLGAGCGSTVAPARCPSKGGNVWTEITTKHFVLRTDADEARARAAAEDFENDYAELVTAGFPRAAAMTERLAVIVLRDERERQEYWPFVGGFYATQLGGDLERTPTLVFSDARYAKDVGLVRRTMLHELTHRFVALTYGTLPIWLNEGLAQYFSTMRRDGDTLVLGATFGQIQMPPPMRMPTIAQLLALDRATFYGDGPGRPEAQRDRRWLYYEGSWALVHFLRNGPDAERARFRTFLNAVANGARADDAWAVTLGVVPPATLGREFFAYLGATRWDSFVVPMTAMPDVAIERARTLDDVETDLLWARILGGRRETQNLANAAIDEAALHAPRSPEVAYWRGCAALAQDRPDVARVRFLEALAGAPDDPRALYGLARSLDREWGRRDVPPEVTSATADIARRLALVGSSPDELAWVAAQRRRTGDFDGALTAVNRAMALESGYYFLFVVRAQVHFAAGRFADAVIDQERAVAIAPDTTPMRDLLHDLTTYRERLARQRATAMPR